MSSPVTQSILNRWQLLGYGALGWPLAMLGIPLYLYLPAYYQQNYDLSLAIIGLALLAARLTDVLTDPLIGHLSDALAAKVPRAWQVLSGFSLLLLGIYQLFFPQGFNAQLIEVVSGWQLVFWSFVTYLGWTWVQVPYLTLASERSDDAFTQSRLSASREGLAIVGVLSVLLLPLLLQQSFTELAFFQNLFWVFVGLLGLAGLSLLLSTPRLTMSSDRPSQPNPIAILRTIVKQQPILLKLLPIYLLNNLANALPATLFVFFVADYLQLDADKGLFLLVYFLSGVLALPVWLQISKRWGKAFSWQLSMGLAGFSFLGVFWLETGDFNGFMLICILTGLSLGVDLAMPASMQADLAQQQPQWAGLLFGLWGMVTKFALALAAGLALPLYDWGKSLELSTDWVLLGLYAGLPIVLKLWAMGLLQRFKRL